MWAEHFSGLLRLEGDSPHGLDDGLMSDRDALQSLWTSPCRLRLLFPASPSRAQHRHHCLEVKIATAGTTAYRDWCLQWVRRCCWSAHLPHA